MVENTIVDQIIIMTIIIISTLNSSLKARAYKPTAGQSHLPAVINNYCGSVVTSLLTDQEVSGSIIGSAVGICLADNYFIVCKDWVLL